jgi:LPXTG-motif cell wall-anchored protein
MKKDTKKRILVWLLMLSLLLPLPGMTNEVRAEENPTPPSPPNLTTDVNPEDPSTLIMECSGDPSKDWIHEWRLSSTPDMMSSIWADFSVNAENMFSIEFTESLRNMIDGIVYVAVRYVYYMDSSLGSGWSNIYSVEIDDNGHITNVEPAEMETNPTPNESPSSKSTDGKQEAQTVQPTEPDTQPSDTLPETEESGGNYLWLALLVLVVLLLAGGLFLFNRRRTSKQKD